MSAENPKTIIEIKKNIQSIVSKLMSNTVNTLTGEETSIIQQISKYKVANQGELKRLSELFDNVLEPPSSDSGTS